MKNSFSDKAKTQTLMMMIMNRNWPKYKNAQKNGIVLLAALAGLSSHRTATLAVSMKT